MTTAEVRIPSQTVEAFLEAYRRHDVDEMVDLCTGCPPSRRCRC